MQTTPAERAGIAISLVAAATTIRGAAELIRTADYSPHAGEIPLHDGRHSIVSAMAEACGGPGAICYELLGRVGGMLLLTGYAATRAPNGAHELVEHWEGRTPHPGRDEAVALLASTAFAIESQAAIISMPGR
jgi:hypothetical protein